MPRMITSGRTVTRSTKTAGALGWNDSNTHATSIASMTKPIRWDDEERGVMRIMNMRRFLEVAATLSLAGLVGCAVDVPTIDRTQPNALDKTMFEGIWYHRATIASASPESGETEGITSSTFKLRWE